MVLLSNVHGKRWQKESYNREDKILCSNIKLRNCYWFCLCLAHVHGQDLPLYTLQLIQWSLYFKTTHGTKKIWSYIAGGLKIKVI